MSDTSQPAASASPTSPASPATSGDGGELVAEAAAHDRADELAGKRAEFTLDDDTVYLVGNSLGPLPRSVPGRLAEVVGHEWGRLRKHSWSESGWWQAPERIGDRIAPLVGAAPGQLVVGDSTSVNVLKAVVGALRIVREASGADDRRRSAGEVLVDADTFPTDGYVAASAARMTGARVRSVPADEMADAVGPDTAVALVNHVDYRTGELRDVAAVTQALHRTGGRVVWDVCHSAGALPVELDATGADFAVGCTYKYLNGGPGAPAFLYVRRELQHRFDSPLPGWHSHAEPFAMAGDYVPAEGAARGRVGTPDILSMLALEEALRVWDGVEIAAVRAKSLALSDFFLECVRRYVPRYASGGVSGGVELITPERHRWRGSQIALRCADAEGVTSKLQERGVVIDFRTPDTLRIGFTPLYTSFAEVERAARELGEVLVERAPR